MGGFDWHTFLFEYGKGRCSRDDHVLDDESLYILVQESYIEVSISITLLLQH